MQRGSRSESETKSEVSGMAGTNILGLALSIATFRIVILQRVMSSTPTVFPAAIFNPEADATRLENAMHGFGTDEDTIINILAYRNNTQRLQIAQKFKTMYGENLVQELKSELSGDFEDAIVALMTPLPEFYAREMFDAIAGFGTNEAALIEVLATLSNHEIKTIAETYKKLYGTELVEDIKGDTSRGFKELLVLLCRGMRNEDRSEYVDSRVATVDAQKLFEAGQIPSGIDAYLCDPEYNPLESEKNLLTNILVFRSYSQLRSIFEEYERISGISIEDAIERDVVGDLKDGFLAFVTCIRKKATYFAERLHEAITGLGTDEKTLIRIIVTRSEDDLGDIKTEYGKKYKNSLVTDIEEDCSGNFEDLLMTILGETSYLMYKRARKSIFEYPRVKRTHKLD